MNICCLIVRLFVVFVLSGRFLDLHLSTKAIGISIFSLKVPDLLDVSFH